MFPPQFPARQPKEKKERSKKAGLLALLAKGGCGTPNRKICILGAAYFRYSGSIPQESNYPASVYLPSCWPYTTLFLPHVRRAGRPRDDGSRQKQ